LFIFADFELNRKFIAEQYCINKNRPWMHCNGHCYLMKMLNEAQENQNKDQGLLQRTFSLEAIVETLPSIGLPVLLPAISRFKPLTAALFSTYLTPPFHPPQQA
jgi:hypothetical protein